MNGSKYSGHEGFEWAMNLNRISLDMIGLWPKPVQNRREKLTWNLRTLLAFLTLSICIIIPSLHALIKIYSDIILAVDNLILTIPFCSCSLRILIFWWKKEAMVPIVIMIAEDWLKLKSAEERNVMVRWAQGARTIIKCAYTLMGLSFIVIIILPRFGITARYVTNITDLGKPLPFHGYYVYDITKKLNFEITYIIQVISSFVAIMTYVGIDNFLALLTFHICGQLIILKNRLMHLPKFSNFNSFLRSSIMDHRRLLRGIDIIEDAFNIILLIMFLYFVIIFALFGFLLIQLVEEGNNLSVFSLMRLVTMIISLIGHMFLYCAVGDLLVVQCDGIHYAVCHQEWYSLYPKDAKMLIPLLIKSGKPTYLTAGKVFSMTIPTFCNLLKTSAGYISVLLTTTNQ